MSDNYRNVARLFINYVKFSLATTRNVKSTLTNCTVMQDYYGGGRLGKVAGDAESILNSCTIYGNVFGGGFTGILPTVEVMNTGGFPTPPYYDYNLGVYLPAVFPETVTYTWEHRGTVNSTETAIDKVNHILYTEEDTGVLGTVTGHTKVTVTGNTYVEGLIDGEPAGGVFGGGNEAWVGSSEVIINTEEEEGSYPINNVYGGGYGANTATYTNPGANVGYRTDKSRYDKGTGKAQSIRVEGSSSLSKEEIERMKAEAEANADSDKKEREKADAVNKGDRIIFEQEKMLEDQKNTITESEKSTIEGYVSQMKDAVKAKDVSKIN